MQFENEVRALLIYAAPPDVAKEIVKHKGRTIKADQFAKWYSHAITHGMTDKKMFSETGAALYMLLDNKTAKLTPLGVIIVNRHKIGE